MPAGLQLAARLAPPARRLLPAARVAGVRYASRGQKTIGEIRAERNSNFLMYTAAVGIFCVGMSYAAVPLYRLFCQASGFAGTVMTDIDPEYVASMKPVEDRVIKINFNADTGATMRWDFKPLQQEVTLVPGETALAFYTATNPTNKPVIGISTYNVIPYDAGQYFNKIQCFCFEEQCLNPNEQVDMPVFFYIDPAFAEDPRMYKVDEITLSYTFFESKDTDGILPGTQTADHSHANNTTLVAE